MRDTAAWLLLIVGIGCLALGLWQIYTTVGPARPPHVRRHLGERHTPRARIVQGVGYLVYGLGAVSRALAPPAYDLVTTWGSWASIWIALACWLIAKRINTTSPAE